MAVCAQSCGLGRVHCFSAVTQEAASASPENCECADNIEVRGKHGTSDQFQTFTEEVVTCLF